MSYRAITNVSCGKIYSPGEIIPDDALTPEDIQELLGLNAIASTDSKLTDKSQKPPKSDPSTKQQPNLPQTGVITDEAQILNYVNNADVAALEKIKGVGTATAKAMKNHGKFTSVAELSQLVTNVHWESIEIV